MNFRLTLSGVLWLAVAGFTALLAGLYFQINRASEKSVDVSADQVRDAAITRVGDDIEHYLLQGEQVALQLDAELKAGKCRGSEAESCLLSELLGRPDLSEISLTEGKDEGFGDDGLTQLNPVGRRQVLTYRAGAGETVEVCTQEVSSSGDGGFTATTRCRRPHQLLSEPGPELRERAPDPTVHLSFSTPARDGLRGRTIWTDLSYSEVDPKVLDPGKPVVVSMLRSVENDANQLLGVVKVSLLHAQIRDLVRKAKVNANDPEDPYRIFIADENGRLITPVCDSDVVAPQTDDELRISSKEVPPEIDAALKHPRLLAAEATQPSRGEFMLDGKKFIVSYRLLADTRDWRLGVVGPDEYFKKDLNAARTKAAYGTLAVLSALFLGGLLALRVIRRAFSQVAAETGRMSRFEFAPAQVKSRFADVRDALYSLEKAKTAVRAMGRYVPLALVRRLFEDNAEPVLGGTLREVTIFFSDIEGFTTRAEAEPPGVVAQWLGRYLEVMTTAVHGEDGTVDKFIGDSVMALWNAPKANPDHAVLACRAALRCQSQTQKLYQSPEWAGRAPLVTRIGLHVDAVMVGHFGAPDRLSYTAIGDGVNLASRIEGLNKQYGTTMLVSEEVYKRACHAFAFRRLDTVAVKGKSQAIGVYELLGPLGEPAIAPAVVQRYEQALATYCAGDFAKARALLLQNPGDAPSKVLAEKCAELERHPPAQPWAGISFAHSK